MIVNKFFFKSLLLISFLILLGLSSFSFSNVEDESKMLVDYYGEDHHPVEEETVSNSLQKALNDQQVLAFPGADGWGRYTTGGRGGRVIYVTNLNDSGAGSLREAVNASGARTIVFGISGTIHLQSTLRIKNDNITIAGQTAPGDGICIKGRPVDVNANNVIIRHIRLRMGDYVEDDSFKGTDQRDIIIDHCSMSWGVDEVASFYRNENFTMQNCIISESLFRSIHSKGDHGYGGIWGGNKASFIRNLIAHHTSRTPRFNGARYLPPKDDKTDFRNNVIYNWGFNNVYAGDPNETWGTKANINVVNNYYKPGPATNSGAVSYRVLEPYSMGSFGYSLFYVDGNESHSNPNVLNDNWGLGVQGPTAANKAAMKVDLPFEHLISETLTASEAFEYVLANAGARLPRLDLHDSRIVEETRTGTATYGGAYKGPGTGIIDLPSDVGGWPELFSAPAPTDTDSDGMPDEWEIANGLDPLNPDDRNYDMHELGYTNLEYYLNSIEPLADFVRPPSSLMAKTTGITEITLRWTDNSDNEEGFYLERKSNGQFEVIRTLPPNSIAYIGANLKENTEYTFRIRAFNAVSNSSYSNQAVARTYSAASVPKPVENPYPAHDAIHVSTKAVLTWKPSLGADSYDIYFGESPTPQFVVNQTGNSYNANIQAGKTYYWRVEAVNQIGKTDENKVWKFAVRELLPAQLVGHWSLDSYSNLIDSSEFSNNGTAVNIGFAASVENAPRGRAIRFNGTSQYIQVPHAYEFDFEDNSFTVAFWVRHDASMLSESTATPQPYVFKGSDNGNPESHFFRNRWEIYSVPAENRMVFSVDDGNELSSLETPAEPFVSGGWVHVAAVRDRELGKLLIYADGILMGQTGDNTGDVSQYEDLFFAHRPHDNAFCRGSLDDVRLYNYAFSQTDLNAYLGLTNSSTINLLNENLDIYPNPAKEHFNIKLPHSFTADASIQLYDTMGRRVKILEIEYSDHHLLTVNTAGIPNGTYFVHLTTSRKAYVGRLVIKHK